MYLKTAPLLTITTLLLTACSSDGSSIINDNTDEPDSGAEVSGETTDGDSTNPLVLDTGNEDTAETDGDNFRLGTLQVSKSIYQPRTSS